ncbi:MAG: iron-containing alcohol dehydrogenase [Candidatus Shapirobacteria bacterium]|jgi:glycerol-1-phosphate dehydrogenase [NAD(P)+]
MANEKTIGQLPKLVWMNIRDLNEKRKVLLIANKTILDSHFELTSIFNNPKTLSITSSTKADADSVLDQLDDCEVIYAVGSGRTIDVARYLASQKNKEIICVPTMISSDAFLVNCTGLRENQGVTYYQSKAADMVILDWNLLGKIDKKYNIGGCGDVLSIYTGLWDWKHFDDNFSESVAITAQGILDGMMSEVDEIAEGSQKGLEAIINALVMEVELCYLYGNSRPEEGAEHFFAYCVESKVEHFLHGEMVGFGILLGAFIQGQDVANMRAFMDKVGLNYRPNGLTKDIVVETLKELPTYVKNHNLVKSVYNEFNYETNKNEINSFIDSILIK